METGVLCGDCMLFYYLGKALHNTLSLQQTQINAYTAHCIIAYGCGKTQINAYAVHCIIAYDCGKYGVCEMSAKGN